MTANIIQEWNFNPLVLLLAAMLIYFFYLLAGFKHRKNTICFSIAILFFLLVTCSPLHYLGMRYYFSAHMIAHVILLLVCGPLLVISIPADVTSSASKVTNGVSAFFAERAALAWLAGVGIMWLLHVPVIFDRSFASMHSLFSIAPLLHSGSMLLAGMLFSWPLFGPVARYHIYPLAGVFYLFTACISCSLLGLLITFAPLTTYRHYIEMSASMGNANPLGISVGTDQQAAGLIMWVPCCFVYLTGCMYLLHQWFSKENAVQKNELGRLKNTNGYD